MSQKRATPVLSASSGETTMRFDSAGSACISHSFDPSGGLTIATTVDNTTSEKEVAVSPPTPRLFPPGRTFVDAKDPARCQEVATPSKDAVAACFTRTVQGLPDAERKWSIP
jgi:hypothetical protein